MEARTQRPEELKQKVLPVMEADGLQYELTIHWSDDIETMEELQLRLKEMEQWSTDKVRFKQAQELVGLHIKWLRVWKQLKDKK
jgi:hypothetical protein